MGKAYPPEKLATRTFWITMAGSVAFIGTVFIFVL